MCLTSFLVLLIVYLLPVQEQLDGGGQKTGMEDDDARISDDEGKGD